MKKLQLTVLAAILVAAASASAQTGSITISGSALAGLTYKPNDGSAGGVAQYIAATETTPDVAHLYTPDSGLTGDSPAVFVKNNNVAPTFTPPGTSLGTTLDSFTASYTLTLSSNTQPYWLTYLYAPGGGFVGVITLGGQNFDGNSLVHVIYIAGASGPSDYWGDSLTQLISTTYGATTFGQLTVYAAGLEIGDSNNLGAIIPATADIDSITVSNVTEAPEPSTYAAAIMGFGMLVGIQRLRKRAK
jgi:hypothetical protein